MPDLIKTPMAGPNVEPLPFIQPNSAADVTLALTATSAQTAALTAVLVRVVATVACHLAIGANPTATTSNLYLPANLPEYFLIDSGQKIAAVKTTGAADGQLFIASALLAPQ
ncbi:MAG: hypothetical protein ACK5UY_08195 [Holosporales bacterium]